ISLRMEGLRKCVRMRLRDYGEKVFPQEMKGRSHDMIKPGGLGLHLIRNAFDQVNYIHKRRGTDLVLPKNPQHCSDRSLIFSAHYSTTPFPQPSIFVKPPEPDAAFEISLRPPAFSEFNGQIKVRERLELMVEAAKKRGDVLEHILLSGPSGLGKTTLAYIIANAMNVNIKNTSGPVIEKAGELAGLLTSLEKGDVLFIDEIHRLQPAIEEYLYPAMEDYRLDIIIDQGPQARSLRLNLPKFTLVGATTRAGMVSAPLRSRFGMTARLDYYHAEEMQKIIVRS